MALLRHSFARPLRAFTAHVLVGLGACLLHLCTVGALYATTHGRGLATAGRQVRGFFHTYFMLELVTYLTLLGGLATFELLRRNREAERQAAALRLRAAELESRAAEAELSALRAELHPHFFFNTLNAISGLVRLGEQQAAVRVLELLGDLLRATLGRGSEGEVPLSRELELLGSYLEIERTRFRDRLRVELSIDPAARAALVPPLLLQPLVENAVRHGIAAVAGPGRVGVRASLADDALVLTVEDSGPGFPPQPKRGIGLGNTAARLAQMYGGAATLRHHNLQGGGAQVTLTLPLRSHPDA